MIYLLLLFDVAPEPGVGVRWVALIPLLAIVFILAVGFTSGLVFLLIRIKRRKLKQAEIENSLMV